MTLSCEEPRVRSLAEPMQTRDEAIQSEPGALDCFAEPVIGRRFAPTRWLAMTTG